MTDVTPDLRKKLLRGKERLDFLMSLSADDAAIYEHLDEPLITDGAVVQMSSFNAILRDAREATGRNLDTGLKENPAKHGNWLGTAGYLIFLEQVGHCFAPKSDEPIPDLIDEIGKKRRPGAFEKGLWHFGRPEVNWDQIQALYALRCCFVHDYSLANTSNIPRRQHCFSLISGHTEEFVELPKVRWDGNLHKAISFEERTRVNVQRLGDLAETICVRLRSQGDDQKLRIILEEGEAELRGRFRIFVSTITFNWADKAAPKGT